MGTTITDIKFDCTHCGQKMVVDSSAAGLATDCPQCSTSITIPRRASLHDAAPMPTSRRKNGNGHGNGHGSKSKTVEPEVAAARQELAETDVQISRSDDGHVAEIEKLKKEKRKLRDDLVQMKKEVAELHDAERRALALAGEINRMEADLTHEQEQTARLRGEVDAYVAERTDILPRLETAEAEVVQLRVSLQTSEAELQQTRTNLSDTQGDRTKALRDIQELEARLADLSAELASLRTSAAQTEAKLKETNEELTATKKKLFDTDEAAKSLAICVAELEKERDALKKSLSQDTTGKDLVIAREQLLETTKERDRLTLQVERLNGEAEAAGARQRKIEEDLKSALRELDEARRRAEAASELRLRQDNEVLRGIIARQNTELEQRHAVIVRLKRAQFGTRLAYAAFFIALLGIALWAMKAVPALRIGNLF